jgi:hypothetical protein
VLRIEPDRGGWRLTTSSGTDRFDAVVLATPPHVTRGLLEPLSGQGVRMAGLLPQQATSAIVVALAFDAAQVARMRIPRGFGFVVPPVSGAPPNPETHPLLACTFVHQKFPGRVPEGAALLRAFFGGHSAAALLGETDDRLAERARLQLGRVLGPLPEAAETLVRRWPLSMPQYAVGHLDRMAELESLLSTMPGLHLVGSAYHGVGLADLIRQGRATAPAFAVGCGQFLMVRRDPYRSTGGHSQIRTTMHDGLLLPRLFRRHRLRTDIADLTHLATCRMYHNASEVWRGLAKNATEGMAAPARILPFTFLIFCGQILPLLLAFWLWTAPGSYSERARSLIFIALAASFLPRLLSVWRYRQPLLSACLHPLGVTVLLALQWHALARKLAGQQVTWKERAYPVG